MKTWITALALSAAALPALATDVGVSIGVSQPGIYGRVDIGRFPAPAVILPQPVIIARPAMAAVAPEPVYLWVPPGHRQHWGKQCHRYNACGVPVYFVEDRWYDQHVMAERRHERRGDRREDRREDRHGRGHGRD